MKWIRNLIIVLAVLGFLALNLVLFQVDATEAAIVTQFGEPVRVITEPGLYVKLPDPVQSVVPINRQLKIYNLPRTEFLTADKKNIVVEAYATWEVTDALQFLKTVRDPVGAEMRLADIIASALGAELGQVELAELVTVESEQMRLPEMLATVSEGAATRTEPLGFIVTDVRLKQLTFPEANLTSVYQRMRAEREAIARQFRSEGTEQAAGIRAEADAQRAQILATANEEAANIRGEADAQAIAIYAEAFGKDLEFYEFLRTLESYQAFIDDNTTLILPSDSELLQYLNPAREERLVAPAAAADEPEEPEDTAEVQP